MSSSRPASSALSTASSERWESSSRSTSPPLPIDDAAMTEQVELTVLGRGHQPRGWLLGRARRGPLLERSDERVARELSASATSRTTRASEAMSFGASLFQMSAIAACASDEDTARVHHP